MPRTDKRKTHEEETNSAGQSGDIQQISNTREADSESVEELAEEGNAFEAEAIEGVEDAQDPDVSEVITREVPEDDVPEEYQNDSNNDVA
jgi:N utilization substance protein A